MDTWAQLYWLKKKLPLSETKNKKFFFPKIVQKKNSWQFLIARFLWYYN